MSLDLHPSCKYVASAGMDNVILLWDINKQIAPNRLTGHKVNYQNNKESNSRFEIQSEWKLISISLKRLKLKVLGSRFRCKSKRSIFN